MYLYFNTVKKTPVCLKMLRNVLPTVFPNSVTRVAEEIKIALRGLHWKETVAWHRLRWFLPAISLLEAVVGSKVVEPCVRDSPWLSWCSRLGGFYFKCSPVHIKYGQRSLVVAKIVLKQCQNPMECASSRISAEKNIWRYSFLNDEKLLESNFKR